MKHRTGAAKYLILQTSPQARMQVGIVVVSSRSTFTTHSLFRTHLDSKMPTVSEGKDNVDEPLSEPIITFPHRLNRISISLFATNLGATTSLAVTYFLLFLYPLTHGCKVFRMKFPDFLSIFQRLKGQFPQFLSKTETIYFIIFGPN